MNQDVTGRLADKTDEEISSGARSALMAAGAAAQLAHDNALYADSLLLAMLSEDAAFWEVVFQGQPLNVDRFRSFLKSSIETRRRKDVGTGGARCFTNSSETEKTLAAAYIEGIASGRTPRISLSTLLIGMLTEAKQESLPVLLRAEIDVEALVDKVYQQQRLADGGM